MRLILLVVTLFLITINVDAAWQRELSVGNDSLDSSAIYQVNSTLKGSIYAPLMTLAERNAITSPATGLGVFSTSTNEMHLYDGSGWVDYIFAARTQILTNKTIDSSLNTITNLVDADISASADITRNKLAPATANYVLINDGSGEFSEEQFLAKTRGGTGITSTATFPSSGVVVTEAGVQTITLKDIDGGTASNTNRITLPKDTTGNLAGLTDKAGNIYYDTTLQKVVYNDGADNIELESSGASSNLNITFVTTAYTALLTDDVIIASSGVANYDVDLPTAVGNTGKVFTIIKRFTGFILGVDPTGAELIGVHPAYNLGALDSYVQIVSRGGQWSVISNHNPIYSRYNTAAGQSIPSGVQTRVDYGTLFAESHAGWTVTGAGVWSFTADMAGQYNIRIGSLFALQSWNVGSVALPIINKNGSNVGYAMPYYVTYTGNQSYGNNGFIKINLSVGDTIWTEILQNDGFARTLDTDSIGNFIEITAEF